MMATDTRELADQRDQPDDDSDPSTDRHDRSSLKGDFIVMIADQTVEDDFRGHPEGKRCEDIDGVVYLHSYASNMPEPIDDPDDPTKVWYDRSSLNGDSMVMIRDQTVEDYLRRAPENKICEYIDGIVYMPSPASLWHQFDVFLLAFLLDGFTAERQIGHLQGGPASLRLPQNQLLEPDLFVLPFTPEAEFRGHFIDPPILLVVEVLSKSTRYTDLNRKAELYHQAEASEVWFVDDRDEVLIVHRRTESEYEVEQIESGFYHCRALPGFWIDVSWLWARPRPSPLACLNAILAGPPA
jgi:Uma2 family endonuclease